MSSAFLFSWTAEGGGRELPSCGNGSSRCGTGPPAQAEQQHRGGGQQRAEHCCREVPNLELIPHHLLQTGEVPSALTRSTTAVLVTLQKPITAPKIATCDGGTCKGRCGARGPHSPVMQHCRTAALHSPHCALPSAHTAA